MWPSWRSLGSAGPERRFPPESARSGDPSRKGLNLCSGHSADTEALDSGCLLERQGCSVTPEPRLAVSSPGFWCPPSVLELGQAPGKCAEKPTDFQPHADSFQSPSTSTKMEPLTFQRDLTAQGSAPLLQDVRQRIHLSGLSSSQNRRFFVQLGDL